MTVPDLLHARPTTIMLTTCVKSVQIAVVMAICAVALAVCCALVSTAELKARPTALYGLGSGEEQDAENSIVTTFEVCNLNSLLELRDSLS